MAALAAGGSAAPAAVPGLVPAVEGLARIQLPPSVMPGMLTESLRLRPGVPVVVDPLEPAPVLRAAEDLRRDLERVLGVPSPRLDRLPSGTNAAAIVIACGGAATAALRDPSLTGAEAHAVFVRGGHVVLQGADLRGTIYAVYSFSDRFLDVPPWWIFAEWTPPRLAAVEVPRDTALRWASPQVAWRAWFPNDQDLLSPWIQKDYAARWNLLVETMLRLKLNTIDIGEVSEKGTRKIEIPRDRGLVVTTTHMAPFGASLRNWDAFWAARGTSSPPRLALANVAALEQFWEAHIRLMLRQKVETVWMIGFRGDGDRGFHRTFPDAPADAAGRARVVEDMMRRQVALLRRVAGDPLPPMRTVLYDEVSDHFAAGLLRPPDEPALIWNFVNARRDHFPATDLRSYRAPPDRRIGYYFNAQFTETGSHLADGEGPWKMERNFRRVRQSGTNLVFSVINSGNSREFPLTLAAHARMMWDFDAYDSDRFTDEFCRRYWGEACGPEAARLHRDFYDAYWQQRKPDMPDFPRQYIFHDLRLARAARDLLRFAGSAAEEEALLGDRDIGYYRIVPADCGAATRIEAVIAGCGASAAKFQAVSDRCAALAPRLPETGRAFFDRGLRRQAAFMAAASRSAVATAEAARDVRDREAYRSRMREADEVVREMEALLADAPSGPFAGWYAPESIFKLGETKSMVERRLKGMVPKPPKATETP